MSLTDDIRDYALDLGYHSVGITTAEPFPAYTEALQSRYNAYEWATEGGLRLMRSADPRNCLSDARSIVVAVYDYTRSGFPPKLLSTIGRMYLGRCYNSPPHPIGGSRPRLMREFLEQNGCMVGPWSGLLTGAPDRAAAVRAGLTWIGNNTFAYAPGPGSFIVIHSYVVDVELQYDSPKPTKECPPGCRRCVDACPTGAIIGTANLDPRRCIPYLNFTTQGATNNVIPIELRDKIGTRIHGCDACQEACIWNQARLKARLPQDPYLVRKAGEIDLHQALNATDEYYAHTLYPLMYYMRHKKFLQRNTAIALGNMGDPDSVPHLALALEDPEEVVRGHAAWALGKIGGKRAKEALEMGLARETGEWAREEIGRALLALAGL